MGYARAVKKFKYQHRHATAAELTCGNLWRMHLKLFPTIVCPVV